VVDKGITMAHLAGSLDHMLGALFGEGISTRFRPSYFPSPRPSPRSTCAASSAAASPGGRGPAEPAEGEGWIELGAAAGSEPRWVLSPGGHRRPSAITGFALGFGIDRTSCSAMEPEDHARSVRGLTSLRRQPSERRSERESPRWLAFREYVDLARTASPPASWRRRLTALGLKLEALERPGHDITGPLVIGRC
jgi:hypothetical protein